MINISLLPLLMFTTATNMSTGNGYNSMANGLLAFQIPVLNCDLDNSYIGFRYGDSDGGADEYSLGFYYNNANSWKMELPKNEGRLNHGFEIFFHTSYDDEYGMIWERVEDNISGNFVQFTNSDVNVQYICDFPFNQQYWTIRLECGTQYVVYRGTRNNDWYNSVIYDTIYENIRIQQVCSLNFTTDIINHNLLAYQLLYIDSSLGNTNSIAYDIGYDSGYSTGFNEGETQGYDTGYVQGYDTGYTDGFNEADARDETATAIMSGIVSVGFIPINFFLAIFNWEVFGINIAGFVSSILSVCVLIIVIKHVFSTNGD